MRLRKPIGEYRRRRVCPACGGHLSYDPEVRRRHRAERCACDGLHYPHRRGTRFCDHYAGPRDDEYWREFYGRLAP
ncbi:MAG: hypothetical protein GWO03_07925 [Gammaproteobacteria bacterium]|nr:hypothetical protein [Gammaproteobacteria bacterium]